jgi:hypothetical protein
MSGKAIFTPWRCRTCARKVASSFTQKRFIGDRFVQRKIEDVWTWAQKASDIKGGSQQSMFAILEERGLIHQVTG